MKALSTSKFEPMQPVFATLAAVVYGVFMRLVFGLAFYEVMSWAFLSLVPLAFGFISISANATKVPSSLRAFFFPWLTSLVLLAVTILVKLEGAMCWIMIYPFFAAAAGIGGLLGRRWLVKKLGRKEGEGGNEDILDQGDFWKNDRLQVSLLLVLPLAAGWLEGGRESAKRPCFQENSIEIAAQSAKIWANVTRVRAISPIEDHAGISRWLGVPRPIEAVLDTAAVGGYRKAVFDRGLIFHETVKEYEPERHMLFSIVANPKEIPPTAMDEHIVVGGKYFDVLTGEYRLEPLGPGRFRLRLSSRFVVATPLNFYSSWWAEWIMGDIQANILQVIRRRAELGEAVGQ